MRLVRAPVLASKIPNSVDRELLAWAAGFFDGEGTTIARSDRRRPNYFELEVSVSQSGPDGVPEVLSKFQRAMFGVGTNYPQPGAMVKWDSRGRAIAEMALALMWPWLGSVKKEQAQRAIDLVDRQYDDGVYQRRRSRYLPGLIAHPIANASDALREDLAWAAGFLDGEGYFGLPKAYERVDGSVGFVLRASATQHSRDESHPEVLVKLQRVLGIGRIDRHGEPDTFKWIAEGAVNVRAIVERLSPWLGSVKLTQASAAIAVATTARQRGDSERCVRGHLYDRVDVRPNGNIHRRCSTCDRQRDRQKRLEQGIRPRAFKHPERRLQEDALPYAA